MGKGFEIRPDRLPKEARDALYLGDRVRKDVVGDGTGKVRDSFEVVPVINGLDIPKGIGGGVDLGRPGALFSGFAKPALFDPVTRDLIDSPSISRESLFDMAVRVKGLFNAYLDTFLTKINSEEDPQSAFDMLRSAAVVLKGMTDRLKDVLDRAVQDKVIEAEKIELYQHLYEKAHLAIRYILDLVSVKPELVSKFVKSPGFQYRVLSDNLHFAVAELSSYASSRGITLVEGRHQFPKEGPRYPEIEDTRWTRIARGLLKFAIDNAKKDSKVDILFREEGATLVINYAGRPPSEDNELRVFAKSLGWAVSLEFDGSDTKLHFSVHPTLLDPVDRSTINISDLGEPLLIQLALKVRMLIEERIALAKQMLGFGDLPKTFAEWIDADLDSDVGELRLVLERMYKLEDVYMEMEGDRVWLDSLQHRYEGVVKDYSDLSDELKRNKDPDSLFNRGMNLAQAIIKIIDLFNRHAAKIGKEIRLMGRGKDLPNRSVDSGHIYLASKILDRAVEIAAIDPNVEETLVEVRFVGKDKDRFVVTSHHRYRPLDEKAKDGLEKLRLEAAKKGYNLFVYADDLNFTMFELYPKLKGRDLLNELNTDSAVYHYVLGKLWEFVNEGFRYWLPRGDRFPSPRYKRPSPWDLVPDESGYVQSDRYYLHYHPDYKEIVNVGTSPFEWPKEAGGAVQVETPLGMVGISLSNDGYQIRPPKGCELKTASGTVFENGRVYFGDTAFFDSEDVTGVSVNRVSIKVPSHLHIVDDMELGFPSGDMLFVANKDKATEKSIYLVMSKELLRRVVGRERNMSRMTAFSVYRSHFNGKLFLAAIPETDKGQNPHPDIERGLGGRDSPEFVAESQIYFYGFIWFDGNNYRLVDVRTKGQHFSAGVAASIFEKELGFGPVIAEPDVF